MIIVVTGRADGTGGEGFYHELAHESSTLSVNESVGRYRVDRIGAAAYALRRAVHIGARAEIRHNR